MLLQMSKKDLLDLSLFEDTQRKSEMTIKRPQLVRRSDPSIYDKQPDPAPVQLKEVSKCNFFTTAPEYEYRKFSQVSLEEPTTLDYAFGLLLIMIWMASNTTLLPACAFLSGDLLHSTSQLLLIRICVGIVSMFAERGQYNVIDRSRGRYYVEGVILHGLVALFMIFLVHHFELNSTSMIFNTDSIVVAVLNRHKVGFLGLFALPVLFLMNGWMLALGILTMLLLLRLQTLKLGPSQQILVTSLAFLIFLIINLFKDPLMILNMWTLISLAIFCVNRLICLTFVQIISKHYLHQSLASSLIKSSTIALAVYEMSYIHATYFILLCVGVLAQIICQFVNKEVEQENNTITPL